MGNVRSISCPELRIQISVSKGPTLWGGKDNHGRDRLQQLGLFLETCMGLPLIYHDEGDHDVIDDIRFADFEEGRDYRERPVTDADFEAPDGWVIPTDKQVDAMAEALVKGNVGHVHGVNLITDTLKEPTTLPATRHREPKLVWLTSERRG